jgi:hypothetical protein
MFHLVKVSYGENRGQEEKRKKFVSEPNKCELKSTAKGRDQWFMPVILAICDKEMGRSWFKVRTGKMFETPSQLMAEHGVYACHPSYAGKHK